MLIDMKMSKEEAKEQTECCSPESQDRYPWGLSIHLDDDCMEKLGISNPEVGSEVSVICKCTVTSASARQTMLGDNESSVDLQITAMEVTAAPAEDQKLKALYNKG